MGDVIALLPVTVLFAVIYFVGKGVCCWFSSDGKVTSDGPTICTHCAGRGTPRTVASGSLLIEVILWLCLTAPGLVYSAWRLTTREKIGPSCGVGTMIPVQSPRGRQMIDETKVEPLPPQVLAKPERLPLGEFSLRDRGQWALAMSNIWEIVRNNYARNADASRPADVARRQNDGAGPEGQTRIRGDIDPAQYAIVITLCRPLSPRLDLPDALPPAPQFQNRAGNSTYR